MVWRMKNKETGRERWRGMLRKVSAQSGRHMGKMPHAYCFWVCGEGKHHGGGASDMVDQATHLKGARKQKELEEVRSRGQIAPSGMGPQ